MIKRNLALASVILVVLTATGCGLFETNDDELETLRVEIIQLREDFMEMNQELTVLAQRPVTSTVTAAPTTSAAPATTTSIVISGDSAEVLDDEVPTVTVPVGLNEEAILTATYQWGPSDPAVILQELLGVAADGWYGNGTRAAHLAELESRDLDVSGVPAPPSTTTAAPEETEDASTDEASDGDAADATTTTAAADEDLADDSNADATTTTEASTETTTTTEASE